MLSRTRVETARRRAEAMMTSTCTIHRVVTSTQLDASGNYSETRTLIYSGPCEIAFPDAAVVEVDAQAQIITEQSPTLKLPVLTSGSVRIDDEGELTGHPHDPDKVGLLFRVSGGHTRTFATTRRLRIEVR